MRYYAVIDTNVLVSSLISSTTAPSRILDEVMCGNIVPMYNEMILAEYEDVLHRRKFGFEEAEIAELLEGIQNLGISINAEALGALLPDPDDVVFYEVVMEKRKSDEAYLVTGNIKHFPKEPFIVTPREMLAIMERERMSEEEL